MWVVIIASLPLKANRNACSRAIYLLLSILVTFNAQNNDHRFAPAIAVQGIELGLSPQSTICAFKLRIFTSAI